MNKNDELDLLERVAKLEAKVSLLNNWKTQEGTRMKNSIESLESRANQIEEGYFFFEYIKNGRLSNPEFLSPYQLIIMLFEYFGIEMERQQRFRLVRKKDE